MLTAAVIALAIISFLLFLSLAIVSGVLIREMEENEALEEENSRLLWKLIDAGRYMSRVLNPESRDEILEEEE